MKLYGVDFTSRPRRGKPITCLECTFDGDTVRAGKLTEWYSFDGFEAALGNPGPWIAGIDFPFGQARTFIENIGWPGTWQGYVDHVQALGRARFRAVLDAYRAKRPAGDKEHRRATDIAAGAISPQKLYGTPVALMFFEGAPRLRRAGVTIPALQRGDPHRIAVESYPGVLARTCIGRRSYKQDTKSKQTSEHYLARKDLLREISQRIYRLYGINVDAPTSLAEDPAGDHLDALLCAIQAAWAWTHRDEGFGLPQDTDPLEGWISDPTIRSR